MSAHTTPALETLPPTYKSHVTGPTGNPVEVRKFSSASLQDSIDKILRTIPAGEGTVILDVAAGSEERTVTAVAIVRTRTNWTLLTGFAATFDGQWTGQVQVRKTI